MKLSPNVTDIVSIAKAVEDAGADSVSLINTLLGMAVNAEKRTPILSTVTGGMSGAAVKPIALRMVWQVYNAVKIPVIGLGGIMYVTDCLDVMLCGATAVHMCTSMSLYPTLYIMLHIGVHHDD